VILVALGIGFAGGMLFRRVLRFIKTLFRVKAFGSCVIPMRAPESALEEAFAVIYVLRPM